MERRTTQNMSKRTHFLVGLSALIIAAVLLTLGSTKYAVMVGNTNVSVYPAAFFGLLSVIQFYRSMRR